MDTEILIDQFGKLPDGRAVSRYTLNSRHGISVKVINFGAIITELHTPDRRGNMGDIVLGFDKLEPYLGDSPYFGALIGRYANRICRGCFELDGKVYRLPANNGKHHLHGGEGGFHKRLWHAQPFRDGDTVAWS